MFQYARVEGDPPRVRLDVALAPAGDPNTLSRREVIAAIVAVRRQFEPAPGFSLARLEVPAGELLLALADALGLTAAESIEALGAEVAADLLWPVEAELQR